MTLVFINGFDDQIHSATNIGTVTSNTFNTTIFRTGTASLRNALSSSVTSTGYLAVPIPGGGDATVVVGAALYCESGGSTNMVVAGFCSDNGATIHVTVTLNLASGLLQVWRGSSAGTSIGSTTLSGSAILTNTWGYWEVKCVLSDTVGEVHVRYNGAAVLDITGADTKNAGTKTVIDTVVYPSGYVATVSNVNIDDFYVVTGTGAPNDFLGDCKVTTIYPTGNGDYSQLVGSDSDSTNNYLLVNEAGAPVTTNYVESDTVGQRDFYAMGDISIPATATVLGVQVSAYANNPDGGTGRSAKLGVRQSTSETLSANQALTTATFLAVRGMFTTDPATGAAWTQSGVNSAQAGVEVG